MISINDTMEKNEKAMKKNEALDKLWKSERLIRIKFDISKSKKELKKLNELRNIEKGDPVSFLFKKLNATDRITFLKELLIIEGKYFQTCDELAKKQYKKLTNTTNQ